MRQKIWKYSGVQEVQGIGNINGLGKRSGSFSYMPKKTLGRGSGSA